MSHEGIDSYSNPFIGSSSDVAQYTVIVYGHFRWSENKNPLGSDYLNRTAFNVGRKRPVRTKLSTGTILENTIIWSLQQPVYWVK